MTKTLNLVGIGDHAVELAVHGHGARHEPRQAVTLILVRLIFRLDHIRHRMEPVQVRHRV